jgi:hypothetical protein
MPGAPHRRSEHLEAYASDWLQLIIRWVHLITHTRNNLFARRLRRVGQHIVMTHNGCATHPVSAYHL